jgi:hypothetical protein
MAIAGLTFGAALDALRQGQKIHRSGWNGRGMYLLLVTSSQYQLDPKVHPVVVSKGAFDRVSETPVDLLPWIGMKTADGYFVPWLASQSDILSRDWEVEVDLPDAGRGKKSWLS